MSRRTAFGMVYNLGHSVTNGDKTDSKLPSLRSLNMVALPVG
jgi:hypothetical protein